MNRTLTALAAALALAAPLGGCSKSKIQAPDAPDVCFHAIPMSDGTVKFNRLLDRAPNIETCASALEGMRLKFLRIGGQMQEIMGVYNGQYLFIQKEGVFESKSIDGNRYLLLVRTGDGRLAMVGAMPPGQ